MQNLNASWHRFPDDFWPTLAPRRPPKSNQFDIKIGLAPPWSPQDAPRPPRLGPNSPPRLVLNPQVSTRFERNTSGGLQWLIKRSTLSFREDRVLRFTNHFSPPRASRSSLVLVWAWKNVQMNTRPERNASGDLKSLVKRSTLSFREGQCAAFYKSL